ncbi:MAG: DegT/DnrJ/EryC1/StrS family aminotransferase [Bacteroidales bacterium]|jgi:dTDP-4-amino-4,6-dideoxygalactose transaminase|nr:DegT/DnrJ/EryC1/StrS family aminotransferase [Bacteroidales bacterium]
MKIPFSPPYIDDDVIREVNDSLLSGWITTGPKVALLEEELKEFTKSKGVVCVNSWTSGAILMLKWLHLEKGDEVIVPAYTYCATAMAVIDAGAKPIMVDINDDLTIDVEKIKEAITPRTKAIIPVDIAGVPSQYEKIKEIITSKQVVEMFSPSNETQRMLNRIMLISDSAHSLGAIANNRSVAQIVDVCILSLHAVKNITSAEGGAICLNLPEPFNNENERKHLKILSLNGQTKDAFTKNQAGGWRYDVVECGLKINLPDVNAAIALSQLRKYDYLLKERKRVYDRYSSLLSKYSWAKLPYQDTDSVKSSYHLYPLRLNPITEKQRDELIEYLSKKEIATNVHYIPMPLLTLFKNMGYNMENYPKAYNTYCREISLPIYPQLKDEEIDYIVNNLVQGYNKVREENI